VDADVSLPPDLPLGAEFPTPDRDQWLGLVDKVLAGAPFDRKLVTTTADGMRIEPLYTDGDGPAPDAAGVPGVAPFVRGATAGSRNVSGWDVRQWHGRPDGTTLDEVNRAVIDDLEGGATSVVLGPLGANDVETLDRALAGVYLDLAPICLDWGPDAFAGVRALTELWARREVAPSAALGEFGIDPLGATARHGWSIDPLPTALAAAGAAAAATAETYPGVRALLADGTVYADGGASPAEELAYALATGVALLRATVDAGASVADAAAQITFRLDATADQFTTMAKLRAARRCWARVLEVSGAAEVPMHLHACTARSAMSQRDPWVNLLRATIGTFAAATAGADAITVLPFGDAAGRTDDDGRRLARNTQIVLAEESNLARVADPAGGSWYVESFTEMLAQAAWERFRAIEGAGGMAAVLAAGEVGRALAARWEERVAAIATRREPITGVSEFPDLDEPAPAATARFVPAAAAPRAVPPGPAPAVRIDAVPLRRLAAPFEALRDAVDAAATRPTVFLANLGPVATHTARATFAKNLFEVAGIRAVGNDGFEDDDTLVAAFTAAGAPLAVICSSDTVYAERAAAVATALRASGARRVYLAGAPGERRAELEAAGVDEFVMLGVDALDVLSRALDAAGVPTSA